MSKAEERAQAAYPAWRNGIGDEFSSNSAYYGFIEGYHQAEKDLHKSVYKAGFLDGFEDAVEGQYEKGYEQAEKDLELTWEDMMRIDEIITQVFKESKTCQMEAIYQEVLKRFKVMKETKD